MTYTIKFEFDVLNFSNQVDQKLRDNLKEQKFILYKVYRQID
jgi:hypothetical protein